MAYVNFKELKEERPARNFDKVDITEDFDIGAQDGDSLYGTFSFFHGIKSFFKKVMSAASALVSGKILMSDENGNVAGIAPSDLKTGMDLMNSEDVNNALANCMTQDDLHLLESGVIGPEQIGGNFHISKTINLRHTYKLNYRISFSLTPVSFRNTAFITATGHWGDLGDDAEEMLQSNKISIYITNLYQSPQICGCYYQIFGDKNSIVN